MRQPVAVIPARYASIRFPGKPLAMINGKPMVQHVWERCQESKAFERVMVATEDPRIVQTVESFGGECRMTSPKCVSGTDRVAEVARGMQGADHFVNVQGDEPTLDPDALRQLAHLTVQAQIEMATLIRPVADAERSNPNIVKVVVDLKFRALYFSRSDIPFRRNHDLNFHGYAHLGIYGYQRDILLELASLSPSPLEKAESLEQLRALENGICIQCGVTQHRGLGVDTPEDIGRAETVLHAIKR